ncbi:MAG: C40 family peptidase [Clostridia bacterium]|nr:C40 family peptidase [Clostridia bacterium]
MKRLKNLAAIGLASALTLTTAAALAGCANKNNEPDKEEVEITQPEQPMPEQPEQPEIPEVVPPIQPEQPEPEIPVEPEPEEPIPTVNTASYIMLTADSVNIRSGAGTGYAVKGAAEKSTMYALGGTSGSWYQTSYKNATAYLSTKYCEVVEMEASENELIEAVIAEGTKLLGTPYVYGAARYHNGNGALASNFSINAFDCSSLMQYIFYKGAGVNLQVTSRTQSLQGETVSKANLQRGDLMFFTNASRYNYSGIERIGHVALYLGDNWILHTASDYAKIEQISSTRWSYFIKAQRMI